MSSVQLHTPLLDSGIRSINFFNGRLLSAEDLSQEQLANRDGRRRLGQAVGPGIAYGLEVAEAANSSPTTPRIIVTRGLAVDRRGQTLALTADTTVELVRSAESDTSQSHTFDTCQTLTPGVYVSGAGLYILTIAPAQGSSGRAPVSGLGNIPAACNTRYIIEAVQFRLVGFEPSDITVGTGGLGDSRLRNRIAYSCYGVEELEHQPFSAPRAGYGLLDKLHGTRLTACDVPLAVIFWTTDGIRFVDLWSVRRRIMQDMWPVREASAIAPVEQWSLLAGDRRLSEAEAMFLQFQAQITTSLVARPATENFVYLPPAGILPLGDDRHSYRTFFGSMTIEEVTGEQAFLRGLIHQSFYLEPIQVSAPPPIRIISFPGVDDYVVFLRGQRPVRVESPRPDISSVGAKTGSFLVELVVPRDKRTPSLEDVEVWAQHGDDIYAGALLEGSREMFRLGRIDDEEDQVTAQYLITDVPPRRYLIKARPVRQRFSVVSKPKALPAGQQVRVQLRFDRIKADRSLFSRAKEAHIVQLDADQVFKDSLGNVYKKVALIDKYRIEDRLPPQWKDPGFIDPVPELRVKLQDTLQQWLDEDPTLPLTTDDVQIAVRPGYTPGSISDEPYAYLVTAGGSAIPVILTPSDASLPRSVPASRSGVPELTPEVYADKLSGSGLSDMDVFGAAWSGVVAEMLGISTASARTMIEEVRGGVAEARADLTYYNGISRETGRQLRQAGFDDVKLANASLEQIVELLGADASPTFAQRLIDQARGLVPASGWALDAGGLGLKPEEIEKLTALGIDSQGKLAQAAASQEERQVLIDTVGLQENALAALSSTISTKLSLTRARLAPEASLTSLNLINSDTAAKLVEHGVDSVTKLARVQPDTVAATLGISQDQAALIVNEAVGMTLVSKTGLTPEQATGVIAATHATTLDDIAKADVNALSPLLDGDTERASTLINLSAVLGTSRL